MPGARRLAAWLTWATVATVQTCAPPVPVLAQRDTAPRVAVGETASVPHDAGLAGELGDALKAELAALGGVRVAPTSSAHFVLRGSVTRLERSRSRRDASIRCEISLVVADARGGAVRLVLEGRATARGAPAESDRLARTALRAAVHGALRPLGSTLLALQ